jgi:hypothetical protein
MSHLSLPVETGAAGEFMYHLENKAGCGWQLIELTISLGWVVFAAVIQTPELNWSLRCTWTLQPHSSVSESGDRICSSIST